MQIALIDSGIGGLTLLKKLIKTCPHNDYVYFADTYAHPYGRERAFPLKMRLLSISELLYEKGAQMIIFACNTASTVALSYVRDKLPVPIIGVRPLCERANNTLIMCTPLTAESALIKGYEGLGARVYANGCLASLIEQNCHNLTALEQYLTKELNGFKNLDSVILGCTHYVFIKEEIRRITGAKVYDGYDPIIKEVEALYTQEGEGSIRYVFTGPRKDSEYAKILAKIE